MQPVIVLQHAAAENLGLIADALERATIPYRYVHTYAGMEVPSLGDAPALIVMGGPMGVYEENQYPYLGNEKRLIESALRANIPILGVCLGSQLLASVLGAPVYKGPRREIGWHTIRLSDAAATDALFSGVATGLNAFHWHGDIFPLPSGCTPLASSAQTETQAFTLNGKAYGLLCHIEVNRELVEGMMRSFPEEMADAGVDEETLRRESEAALPQLNAIAGTVFDRWVGLIGSEPSKSPQ